MSRKEIFFFSYLINVLTHCKNQWANPSLSRVSLWLFNIWEALRSNSKWRNTVQEHSDYLMNVDIPLLVSSIVISVFYLIQGSNVVDHYFRT